MKEIKKLFYISRLVPGFYLYQSVLLFFAFLITLSTLIEPVFIKELIDKVIPSKNGAMLLKFVVLLLFLYLLRQVFDSIFYYIQTHLEGKLYTRIQHVLLEKATHLPYRYFLKKQKGDMLTLLNEDIHIIENFLSNLVVISIRRAIYLVVAVVFLVYLNLKITIIAIPLTFLVPVLLKIYNKKIKEQSKLLRESITSIMNLIQDFVNHLSLILAWRIRNLILKEHKNRGNKYVDLNVKLYLFRAKGGILAEFVVRIVEVLIVFGLGGYDVIKGRWTLGSLIAYYTYVKMLQPQVVGLFNLGLSISSISASINKIHDFLIIRTDSELRHKKTATIESNVIVKAEHLKFVVDNRCILNDASMVIKRGEKVLLKGQTGAGKSTLIYLILGLYSPTSGRIRLFGEEPMLLDDKVFQYSIGFVPQEPVLFETSILNNIVMGRDYNEEWVEEVLKIVSIYDAVIKLPAGLNSVVGKDDIKLSGGEIQRLALARALYTEPEFLILDEGTAHLDSKTEREILNRILSKERTILFVSHRVNVEQDYEWDRIYRVHNKVLEEVG